MKKTSEAIKRFREKFVEPPDKDLRILSGNNEPMIMGTAKDVENFISQELQRQRKEMVEKIKKHQYNYKCSSGCTHKNPKCIDDIISQIEEEEK